METKPEVIREKPPKTLNARERNFCLLIDKGMKAQLALESAGYNMKGKVAASYASTLLTKQSIKNELDRLYKLHETAAILDYKSDIASRYPKAIEVYDDLMKNGNDYVRKGVADAIIDRVSPKVTRNESVKYTLPAKEKDRINKLLSITDVTVDNSVVNVDKSAEIQP